MGALAATARMNNELVLDFVPVRVNRCQLGPTLALVLTPMPSAAKLIVWAVGE
jgi:hypothetical protein